MNRTLSPSCVGLQDITKAAGVFKTLGSPVRLRMVRKLAEGECCVCELVELSGLSFPTVSRHLSVMKAAGVVSDEKRGQQVFYRLLMPCVVDFCECLLAERCDR